jgi:hypothetical protein
MEHTFGEELAVRTVRVLAVSAVAASVAVVAPPASADVPTYTAFTMDGTTADAGFARDDVFTGSDLAVTAGLPTEWIAFDGTRSDPASEGGVHVRVAANQGTTLDADTTYHVSDQNDLGTVSVSIDTGTPGSCSDPSDGTVNIKEIGTDSSTGNIDVFAADYSVVCTLGVSLSGELRWNSTQGYDAVAATVRNWHFGTDLSGRDGIAKRITFTDRGSDPVTFTSATLTGSTTWFKITRGCDGATLQPGRACTVTVTPHAQKANGLRATATLRLSTNTVGVRQRIVPLAATGSTTPAVYTSPGPGHVRVTWSQLPAVFDASVVGYDVYRGTSASTVSYLRHFSYSARSFNDTGVRGGQNYFYEVRPDFGAAGAGDRTPPAAGRPWPKYMPGMYHRLGHATRFVSTHKVLAGHPYTLRVDGAHGVPGGHVAAVAVEILAQNPTQNTSVALYPAGAGKPIQPDLRLSRGKTRSNFAIVKVGSGGKIKLANAHGTVAVSVDVSGYYSAAGLSSTYGMGSAYITYSRPSTILDTKAWRLGPLPHDYYVNAPVNFPSADTPHVRAFAVQITAYGSKGGGTLTGFATNGRSYGTQVLAYAPNTTTTNFAIVPATQLDVNGTPYPSISLLNRGNKPVQLIMTILGFYDNDFYTYGEHYVPTAPQHLSVKNPMYAGSKRVLSAGYTHANVWTVSLNLHLALTAPTKSTTVKLWPRITGVPAPAHGQVPAHANVNALSSTVTPLGGANLAYLSNSAGRVTVSVWSFGRFDAYPQPSQRSYASEGTSMAVTRPAAPGPVGRLHAVALR